MGRPDSERSDLDLLPHLELGDLSASTPPDQRAGAARDDNRKPAGESAERTQVEVIAVSVGDEDPIQPAKGLRVHLGDPPEVPDAGTQHRVGHDPRAFEVDDDGAVPQPGKPAQRFSQRANSPCALRSSSPSGEVAADAPSDNRFGAGMAMTTTTESEYGRAPGWTPARPKLRPLRLVVAWLASGAALFAAAEIVPGETVNDFWGALLATAAIAVLNALIPPLIAALDAVPEIEGLGL